MPTRRAKPTRGQAARRLAPVAKRGTNFQPHQEATKRTLAKNPYYRFAVPPSEGSATPRDVSGN